MCGALGGPGVKTEKCPYLGLDGRNRDSGGTFPGCNPPVLVVSTPQNGPNARVGPCTGLGRGGAERRHKGPPKGEFWAQKWSKMVLSKNDPCHFGKVYGAYLGRFGPVLTRLAPPAVRPLPLLEPGLEAWS